MYMESAFCGDAIVSHSMTSGISTSPDTRETNTIKQAFSSPDRDKWKEAVDIEMDMNKQFSTITRRSYFVEFALGIQTKTKSVWKRNQV